MAALLSLAAYGAVFGAMAWPWLHDARWGQPEISPFVSLVSDARLITFVLSWVGHALATAPRHLFDMPIFFPASAQLAGTEHFLAAQLFYAPALALTGDPLEATSWTVFLLYPVGAFAMSRLACRLGARSSSAWLAGLVFALGPLRVPANAQTLQYPNCFLPLLYVAILDLRARPDVVRAIGLTAVLVLGAFSSYYMAAMLLVVAALAIALELRPSEPAARQVAGMIAGSGVIAYGTLLAFSRPYFGRPDLAGIASDARTIAGVLRLGGSAFTDVFGMPELVLAALGLAVLAAGDARRRHVAQVGAACAAAGVLLALGPSAELDGIALPLPFALLATGPAAFLRVPVRFTVVAGLGSALLATAALDELARRLPPWARSVAFVLLAMLVLATRGAALSGAERMPLLEASATHAIEEIGRRIDDGEPLVELPALDRLGFLDSDAMMHALRHRAPLATGYTGYPPAHVDFLRRTLARLPEAGAIADLLDATHVRWIVLKPDRFWLSSQLRAAHLGALTREGITSLVTTVDGWTLLRVVRAPAHPSWYAALAAGPGPNRTVLGTPLAPLPPAALGAELALAAPTGALWIDAGQPVRLLLRVTNRGHLAWPASIGRRTDSAFLVGLAAEWHTTGNGPDSPPSATEHLDLPRDIGPGETVLAPVMPRAPRTRGEFVLSFALGQPGLARSAPLLTLPITVR